MEKELVNTLLEKEFSDLSSSERIALNDYCSTEEEFDQLKMVFLSLEAVKQNEKLEPRETTKSSLDAIFAQQYGHKQKAIWYNSVFVVLYPKDKSFVMRPIIQIAAIGLLVLLAYPLFNSTQIENEKPKMANVELKEPKSSEKKMNDSVDKIKRNNESDYSTSVAPVLREQESLNEPIKALAQDVVMDEEQADFAMAAPSISLAEEPILFNHSDGIYRGTSVASFSQPASAQPQVLDLLTSTF